MAVVAAVQQAELGAAVVSTETLEAFASAVQAATLVLAVAGTLGLAAVLAFPSRLTHTAARVTAPVATATTVRFGGNFPCEEKKEGKILQNKAFKFLNFLWSCLHGFISLSSL